MKIIVPAISFSFLLLFARLAYPFEDLSVTAFTDKASYSSTDTVRLVLQVDIPDEYYLYANPLGPGIGKPLQITISETEGIEWVGLRKKAPQKFHPPVGDWVWAYEVETFFFLTGAIHSPEVTQLQGTIVLDGLICKTACIPVMHEKEFTITLTDQTPLPPFSAIPARASLYAHAEPMEFRVASMDDFIDLSAMNIFLPKDAPTDQQSPLGQISFKETESDGWNYNPVEEKNQYNLWFALIFSFLAGVFFNVTPCVFPLLGMKALSLSQSNRNSKRQTVVRSIFFSSGIIAVFLALATLAAYAGFSWGEQFQNPYILTAVIALIFLFALGLFDMYTILLPPSIMNLGQSDEKRGMAGDFLGGMMATVLATPCGGPFLGAVLAWSLLQPPSVIYLIFISMGVGMALPYVLLSSSKRIVAVLPKPGKWMMDLKYGMGFLLLGFSIYLMSSLPPEFVLNAVTLCGSLAFAIAILKRYAPYGAGLQRKISVGTVCLVVISFSVVFTTDLAIIINERLFRGKGDVVEWEDFSASRLRRAHSEGRDVVLNFTASWCMNCRYNEIAVLQNSSVLEQFKSRDVLLLKADITHPNPQAQQLLEHLGSRSIPFLAVFPARSPKEPVLFRDLFSRDDLLRVLRGL